MILVDLAWTKEMTEFAIAARSVHVLDCRQHCLRKATPGLCTIGGVRVRGLGDACEMCMTDMPARLHPGTLRTHVYQPCHQLLLTGSPKASRERKVETGKARRDIESDHDTAQFP